MEIDENDYLQHFGVLGMHWGITNSRAPGVSRSVDKEVRKDAEEFAAVKAAFLSSPKGRSLLNSAKGQVTTMINNQQAKKTASFLSDYLKRNMM